MGNVGQVFPTSEPIAIVGLSCKFAGDARDTEGLWRLMAEKKSAWSKIPSSRFDVRGVYHPDPEKLGTTNVIGGHFIDDDIALFDAGFFNLSTETAASLDPQIRLQLESVYEALENAGIPISQVAGSKTAVYAGLWKQDYRDNLIRDEDNLPRYSATGTGASFAANRISHFFDFRGASMTIDTACSTSLVALHQAVQGLRNRESSMAVIAGSNLMLNADTFKMMASAGFLSADGKSYAFDSRANGYGRGDGVATIIVKRLADALAAGDPIRAVVRETAVNQDGRTDSITTPSQSAQVELMRECYDRAGLNPRDTQYFEAHGTGTATGDPIEAGAVTSVFKNDKQTDQPLRIGSIKTNIGHTEVTSGLAGIIKVALAMERGQIPASINFEKANKKIPLADWGLKLVTEAEAWPSKVTGTKRASINNFGYGGTNAHVIMEDADGWKLEKPEATPYPSDTTRSGVLVLSAKTEKACENMVTNLKTYLEGHKETKDLRTFFESLIYTLGQRRSLFQYVAAHPISLTSGVDAVIKTLDSPGFKANRSSRKPRIGFVFTGQGAQWHAMGRELISDYPIFRESLEESERYLKDFGAQWSLIEELHRDAETSKVTHSSMSIPICVALQIALVRLLRAWDILPTAVTSHSSGEIAAAYAVGALNMKSAMAVAYYRTELTAKENLTRTTKGGMIAVGLGVEKTEEYLARLTTGKAVAACINSPSSVTVAGDVSAIQEIEDMMTADKVFARRLRVDTAYHSHHMDPIAEPYRQAMADTGLEGDFTGELNIAFSSAVTGGRVYDAEELAQPEHWVGSLVQPVQFVDSFQDMIMGDFDPSGSSVDVIVEVGPHTTLGSGIKDILALPELNGVQVPYFGCLVRKTDARYTMQDLAAKLMRSGQPIDLAEINFPDRIPHHVKVLTDVPSYPWVHQTRYWQETRFNRKIRERSTPQNDLLGSVTSWSSPSSPSWRQIIRVDDHPWLRDHQIESSIVYPGAGFISLAVEAVAQIAAQKDSSEHVSGFSLRDIEIKMALVIPDNTDGIEVLTIFNPADEKTIGSKGWTKFEIVSVTSEGRWTHHAQGLIKTETSVVGHSSTTSAESDLFGYTRRVDPDDFYGNLRKIGLKQGPKFQNIKSITQASQADLSVAGFAIAELNKGESSSAASHILHPITLTSAIQAAYTALPRAGTQLTGALVPGSIQKLWISSHIPRESGHLLKARTILGHYDSQSARANVSVFDGAGTSSVLEIENIAFQSFGGSVSANSDKPWEKEYCSKLQWAPDMSLATPEYLDAIKQTLVKPLQPEETDIIMDLRRVCIYFMQDAFEALSPSDVENLQGHHVKNFTWIKSQLQLAQENKLGPDSAQWLSDDAAERARRVESAKAASVNGEMVVQLGPHLAAMLRSEQPPLEVMMEGRLLYRYYKEMLKLSNSFEQAAEILKKAIHKNPQSRILEIGAGTGGATRFMLPVVGSANTDDSLASLYHFTDVSAAFFEAATEEFSEWKDILKFNKLDVEKDPTTQGFELGSYDVVVACQVLHATKSMAHTMANVRRLMKPGGTLILVETTKDQVDVQYVFGLLSGWWLSEEPERHSSPSLTIPFWDQILKGAGFSGTSLEVHDCESDELYSISTIMSTAVPAQTPKPPTSEEVVIVTSDRSPPPQVWLDSLLDVFRGRLPNGTVPVVQAIETAAPGTFANKVCLCIAEAGEEPFLHGLGPEGLQGVKNMTTTCKGLLWVTRGGAHECEKPQFALATGFLRSLRNEYVGRKFFALDLDPAVPSWSNASVPIIAQILKGGFSDEETAILGDSAPADFEFAERNGILHVPRLYKDTGRNSAVLPSQVDYSNSEEIATGLFQQPHSTISLEVGVPGALDTIVFAESDQVLSQSGEIAPTLVEVTPKAYGVNQRDVMAAAGQIEDHTVGFECAGTITKVGVEAAAQGLAVGDSVMCLLPGEVANRVQLPWTSVVQIPQGLTFEEAASIPLAYTTAYYCIDEVARLRKGQSILVHAASGAVGQAAIVLAKQAGAVVFATVGTPDKRALLVDNYGIPTENIFSSRDDSFVQDVLAATNGKGVDVVLNSLSGSLLQATFNILATFGHFIELGNNDSKRNSKLEMQTFGRHTTFSSIDMFALAQLRQETIRDVLAKVGQLVANKVATPVKPLTVLPIGQASQAFRLVQAGQHQGKVVLSIGAEDRVPLLKQQSKVRLSANASYLLVGDLSETQQSLAIWMVQQGAKNLILLANQVQQDDSIVGFVRQIENAGCRVKIVSGDIADASALKSALDACQKDQFPAVRGIVQGSTNVQDSIVERLTIEGFNSAVLPKVSGTWNLHSLFPESADLDFFLLLSSNVGIVGGASQASSAAGGTYQDAFAQWRVAQGLPCVSIDVGMIKAIDRQGNMTNASASAQKAKLGHLCLTEDLIGDIVETAILKPTAQIISGINGGPGSHWDADSPSQLGRDARFLGLRYRQKQSQQKEKNSDDDNLADELTEASSRADAERLIGEAIVKKLADIFSISVEEIDMAKAPTEYGVDSLVAVELRNMLTHKAGSEVASFAIMQSASLNDLAKEAAANSEHVNSELQ